MTKKSIGLEVTLFCYPSASERRLLSSGDLPLRSIQSLAMLVTAAHEAAAGHGSRRRQPTASAAEAKRLLTSERGLHHRSNRPIEPETVFGQIKYDGGFKRFRYRGNKMVGAEFATIAIAHNIRKMSSLMDAERNGRRLSPPRDVPPAARKRVPTSAACGSRA